jgi:type I restriction-modification system DNA methylase subunit
MALKKNNNYISAELEFAEKSLEQWKEYIENNPIDKIEDRWGKKEMPKGGYAHVVTATAESQIKCVQDTLTRYLQLLEVVDKLREKEVTKKEARGSADVPHRMQ